MAKKLVFKDVDAVYQEGGPINTNLESPLEDDLSKIRGKNFWKTTIEYKDMIYMYQRKGTAYRVINKENSLLFKNGFSIDNELAEQIRDKFELDEYVKCAQKYAEIGGWSLIYVDYGDVQDEPDYNTKAPTSEPVGFFVISRGWVWEDIYRNQEEHDDYQLTKADGKIVHVHKSRMIRVRLNDEEVSRIQPAYDSLQVLDNVLWGIGQTMFRSGTGFPVMKLKNGSAVKSENGTKTTRIKQAKNSGIMKDFSSETGFIIDSEDELTFEGAQGKAITPDGYYDRAFQQVAVDLGLPVDILKGTSAGQVTGSETNLREFYSDLKAKQIQQIQPIYDLIFERFQFNVSEFIYNWNKIWEMNQEEVSNNFQTDINVITSAVRSGLMSRDQAFAYLEDNYPNYKYGEFTVPDAPEISLPKNKGGKPDEVPEGENNSGDEQPLHSPSGVRLQYAMSDEEIKKSLEKADDERSALPNEVDKLERGLRKELKKVYKDLREELLETAVRLN